MIKINKTFNFTVTLIFLLTTLTIIFGGIIISYNYYKTTNNINFLANKLIKQMVLKIEDNLKFYLLIQPKDVIQNISIINNQDSIIEKKELNLKLLNQYIKDKPYISSFYIGDMYGNFLQARNEPFKSLRIIHNNKDIWINNNKKIIKKTNYDPRTRPWYNIKKDSLHLSEPYIFSSTKKLGITISYPSYKNNKIKFTIGIDISLDKLNLILKEQSKLIKSKIMILDSKNNIIATSIKNFYNSKKNKLINIKETDFVFVNNINNLKEIQNIKINNKEYKLYILPLTIIKNKNWKTLILIPTNIILGSINKTLIKTLIISIIILFIFIYIIVLLAKKISNPIIEIANILNHLYKLNFNNIDIKNKSIITEINNAQKSLYALKHGLVSFSKYIPKKIVNNLIETSTEAKIGGIEKELAIMFSDIENFTTISEQLTPKELTKLLKGYFNIISKVIVSENGTIDKYIGDAILAFWGAPQDIEDSAYKAVKSALLAQKELKKFNQKLLKEKNFEFKTRFGIHYGNTLVGNIGSSYRINYSIIGDNVNITARLEAINKKYGTYIIISENVYNLVKNKIKTRYLGQITLKGKTSSINIYEAIDLK